MHGTDESRRPRSESKLSRFSSSLLVFCMLVGISARAGATDFAHNGHVDVFSALGAAETQDLLFGVVMDSDGTVTLDTSDSITADPNGIHVGGTVASGDYDITGEPNQTIGIAITGTAISGLAIGNFTTNHTDLSSVPIGAAGSVVLTVGADLTVDSATAVTGIFQPLSYTIAVIYN